MSAVPPGYGPGSGPPGAPVNWGPPVMPGAPAYGPPGAPVSPIAQDSPGTAGYWIGAVAMVLGVIGIIAVSVIGVSRAAVGLRFPRQVDASSTIVLDHPGGYVIFEISRDVGFAQAVPTPVVSVTDPSGAVVFTSTYEGSRTTTGYDPATGQRRRATAVATFHADQSGTYRITASNLPVGSSVGVGRGVDVNGGALALGGMVSGLAILVGLVLVIVTAVRRHGRQGPPGAPPGYPPPGYPPMGYPPHWSPSPYPGSPAMPGPPGSPVVGPYGQPPVAPPPSWPGGSSPSGPPHGGSPGGNYP